MDLWSHCENPYPFVPAEVLTRPTRCARACPTGTATRASPRGYSTRCSTSTSLCDELGINIVTTEHHAGINNLCGANPLVTAIVARITKTGRAS